MRQGRPVRLEFVSADATTSAAMSVYDMEGGAVTLKENELIALQTVTIVAAAAVGAVVVFADHDADNTLDNGERLALGGAGNVSIQYYPHAMLGARGSVPRVVATDAGAVTVVGLGFLIADRSENLGGRPSWDARA